MKTLTKLVALTQAREQVHYQEQRRLLLWSQNQQWLDSYSSRELKQMLIRLRRQHRQNLVVTQSQLELIQLTERRIERRLALLQLVRIRKQ